MNASPCTPWAKAPPSPGEQLDKIFSVPVAHGVGYLVKPAAGSPQKAPSHGAGVFPLNAG